MAPHFAQSPDFFGSGSVFAGTSGRWARVFLETICASSSWPRAGGRTALLLSGLDLGICLRYYDFQTQKYPKDIFTRLIPGGHIHKIHPHGAPLPEIRAFLDEFRSPGCVPPKTIAAEPEKKRFAGPLLEAVVIPRPLTPGRPTKGCLAYVPLILDKEHKNTLNSAQILTPP